MRQLGAPAAGCFLAGHGSIALSAASFHKEIMARRGTGVQRETKWFARGGRFSCQRGEADAILKCLVPAGESRGAVYFFLLQSLTGNSNCWCATQVTPNTKANFRRLAGRRKS